MELAWEKIAFIKALDAIVDYHEIVRAKSMNTNSSSGNINVLGAASGASSSAVETKPKNKFISFLDHVGHDFKLGFDSPVVQAMAKTAVTIFAPAALPLFTQTMASVVTAEQNAAAIGQQANGPAKLASVVSVMGGLIKQALTDVGKPNDDASVEKYISAVVTILDATPVSVAATTAGTVVAAGTNLPANSQPSAETIAAPAAQEPTSGGSAASAIFP